MRASLGLIAFLFSCQPPPLPEWEDLSVAVQPDLAQVDAAAAPMSDDASALPLCAARGDSCARTADCCDGLVCAYAVQPCEDGRCLTGVELVAPGLLCALDMGCGPCHTN